MSKNLHLDCVGGMAGDMFLSAVTALPFDFHQWKAWLNTLPLGDWSLDIVEREECGFQVRMLELAFNDPAHLAHVSDIQKVIKGGELPEAVVAHALAMLDELAQAESAVHGKPMDALHFHELAGEDLVVDLVGAAAAVHLLNPDHISFSPLPMGQGTITIAHGEVPLPAPATLELLHGIPVYATEIQGETVTPTGAAIVRHFGESFSGFGEGRVRSVGIGAGTRRGTVRPNIVRAIWLDTGDNRSEILQVLETNIDDMNPEHFAWVMEKLFEDGALDVWVTPILMKKGRPGQMLACLCRAGQSERLQNRIFSETTTTGLRVREINRLSLERHEEWRDTPLGHIRGKRIAYSDRERWVPEYDELKRLAREKGWPLRVVMEKLEE